MSNTQVARSVASPVTPRAHSSFCKRECARPTHRSGVHLPTPHTVPSSRYLKESQHAALVVRALDDDRGLKSSDADAEEAMLADLARFQSKSPRSTSSPSTQQQEDTLKDKVDKILIADFFFVCFILLLLVVAWCAREFGGTAVPLDIWLKLWNPVFQPAIGVLMLGAILSGTILKPKDK